VESKIEEDGSSPATPGRRFGGLKRILPFLRPYRLAVAGAAAALTVAAGTVLVLGVGLRRLVDEGFRTGNADLHDQALIALLVVIVVLAAASYARFYLVSWIGERVVADIRRAVYGHVIGLSPGFFEVTRTGEILSRLTTDTTLLQTVIGAQASQFLRNLLLFVGGTVLLAITSPRLTSLVFLVVPLVVMPIIFFGRRVRRLSRASQDRIADVGALAEESLTGVRTVQAFAHEELERSRFAGRVEEAFSVAVQRIRARALLTAIVILLVFGAVGIILWVGGHDVFAGKLSAGELSAFIFYAVVVASSVGAISEVVGDLQRAAGSAERLIELLEVEPDIKAPARPRALPRPLGGAITFRDVTFHYPSRPERSALRGINLAAAPGERIALVGPSGAGKSTVFQLLLRFYDPQGGVITVDGIDIREAAPVEVRGAIGLVPQDPVIFSGDGWENIRYGRPDASDEEVRDAARAAGAAEFIERLPEGFSTFLGEKGVRLSGGQKQRIAIARAILKNPTVLLLDEATSALDAESEHAIQEALSRLMAGRTTFIIAHRLATVLEADRIVVFDQGRIVAEGTHAELIRQKGLYARLAALQFASATGAEGETETDMSIPGEQVAS
jgi:ATP-binding cassette subfamily B protein